MYWVKKRLVWGVLDIEEIRDKDNATDLKRGRRNRNVNYSASIHYNDNYNSSIVHTITISNLKKNNFYDNYNLVYSDTTKFQLFDFFSIHCLGLFERYDSIQHIKRVIN
jgi:hypothetical protein